MRGKKVRSPDYGVMMTLGRALNSDAPIEYIGISIKETLLQDPRILSVNNMNVIPNGTAVDISFDFTSIENKVNEYREGF